MATWCGFAPERHASVFITLDKWDKLPPGEIRQELEQAGHPAAAVARMLELYAGPVSSHSLASMQGHLGNASAGGAFHVLSRIVQAVGAAAGGRFHIDFDPTLSHFYLPGGKSATMAIISVSAEGKLTLLRTVPTAAGAHCAVTDRSGHVYVCDPKRGRLLVTPDGRWGGGSVDSWEAKSSIPAGLASLTASLERA